MAPVSNWKAKVVVKFSSADLKKQISANYCLAFVCSKETVSTFRQLSDELDSCISSTW